MTRRVEVIQAEVETDLADAPRLAARRPVGPAQGDPLEEGEPATAVDQLLDAAWEEEDVPYDRRQRLAAGSMSLAFLVAAIALVAAAPTTPAYTSMPLLLVLAAGFAVASRVVFPIGAGYAVPTQLFLVPLFLLAPSALVPLVVLGALLVAGIVDAALGRARKDRLLDVGVDSWHAFAPALVVTLAGSPPPEAEAIGVISLAVAAQLVSEVATSSLRGWLGRGIPPQLQLRVLLPVWVIDLLLTPIAFIAASATAVAGLSAAPLALFGVVLLLSLLTRDRNQRIGQARERLEALRAERSRLEIAVQRIGDAFASKLDLDALLNITMLAAVEALDADGARASANPGAGRRLVRRATTRTDPRMEPAMAAAEQAAAATGEMSVSSIDDVHAVACPVQDPTGLPQAGVLVLARRTVGFTPRKRELLRYLCVQAAVAAADIERHAALHRQALTDDLTGLANHRRLQEVLSYGTESYMRLGTPLALILFDLDDFKQINDSRGHQTGDRVLRSVSQVLGGCCRVGDEAARYGGEELAIVMHATDMAGVIVVAERARAAIEALELVDIQGRDLKVTTSVGVAALGPGIRDPGALIAAADAALYEAKHAGKNRVHFHSGTSAA